MLQGEHSAILLTFIKLPFVIKVLVLSIFEWPLKTDFTVLSRQEEQTSKVVTGRLRITIVISYEAEI